MRAVRSTASSRTLLSLQSLLLLGVFTAPAYAQIETVVVTAERRAVDLQKIPVAVSAFTARDRDRIGINSIQDMASFTPGMTYSTATDRVTLRGISRQTNVLSADSGVANYSDGIYQSFAVEAGRSTLDLDRVEIVRGPQSTLYGRNSIGGAINQITPRPTDEFYAEFRTSYETYDNSTVEGAVSGPIDDNWKYRFYGSWSRQGLGWTKNTIGGPEQGGRINEWYIENVIFHACDVKIAKIDAHSSPRIEPGNRAMKNVIVIVRKPRIGTDCKMSSSGIRTTRARRLLAAAVA